MGSSPTSGSIPEVASSGKESFSSLFIFLCFPFFGFCKGGRGLVWDVDVTSESVRTVRKIEALIEVTFQY